jgi:hypothetical protein
MKLDKLEQPLLGNLLEISKRILLLKQRNRFKAAEAATGSTPCLKSGACAPPSGQETRAFSKKPLFLNSTSRKWLTALARDRHNFATWLA